MGWQEATAHTDKVCHYDTDACVHFNFSKVPWTKRKTSIYAIGKLQDKYYGSHIMQSHKKEISIWHQDHSLEQMQM
jgi:hypothetical protein